jgi:hypothetical protein
MSYENEIEDEENRRLQTTFRKGWPNAYANAIRDVGLVVDAVAEQQKEVMAFRDDLTEKNRRVAMAAKQLVDDAKLKIDNSAALLDEATKKMEASYASVFLKLQEQQASFLFSLIAKQRSIDDDRRELHEARQNWTTKRANEMAEILADKKAFAAEVHKFWSLGFWGRLFVPKSLRYLSKKYAFAGS